MIRAFVLAVALLLVTLGSGCAAAGFAAYVLQPPPKVEAKYKPTSRPIVVFVDSDHARGSGAQALAVRDSLASFIVEELQKNKVGEVVESYKVYDLRTSDPKAFKTMTVDEVGRRTGGEQIIYVDLKKVAVGETTGGKLLRGELVAIVKMVDATTGKTVWPDNLSEGYPLDLDTPFTMSDETTSVESMREGIARSAADQIAKLFYTYTLPQ